MPMKKSRKIVAINAGSMADIAFLLLIFFLTTTSIYDDRGLSVILPEFYEGPVGQMHERNVGVIRININQEVLFEGSLISISEVKESIKNFVSNPDQSALRPHSPSQAVVSIQHDADINYQIYMEVYSEIKAAYRELYDEYSMLNFGVSFATVDQQEQNLVRKVIPITISEAEYKF